uniref:Uncharacterized protein n=1 Tax=Anolis carolinensis TaxID=28377 RepID=A0A803TYK6_ANOCA
MFYADFILETALSPFWERGRYTNKLLLTYLLTKERKGLRSAAQWKSIHVVSPNTQVWMLFHFHPSPVREDGGELLLPRPLLSPSFLGSVPFLLLLLPCSRNQLSSLPSCVCRLPLKVLIASNNKLASLPEDIGALRSLRQLDVSSNELQSLPSSVGGLESLRDLNLRKNQISCLPEGQSPPGRGASPLAPRSALTVVSPPPSQSWLSCPWCGWTSPATASPAFPSASATSGTCSPSSWRTTPCSAHLHRYGRSAHPLHAPHRASRQPCHRCQGFSAVMKLLFWWKWLLLVPLKEPGLQKHRCTGLLLNNNNNKTRRDFIVLFQIVNRKAFPSALLQPCTKDIQNIYSRVSLIQHKRVGRTLDKQICWIIRRD